MSSFFDDILSRLPSANADPPPPPTSSVPTDDRPFDVLGPPSFAANNDNVDDNNNNNNNNYADDDLEYNLPDGVSDGKNSAVGPTRRAECNRDDDDDDDDDIDEDNDEGFNEDQSNVDDVNLAAQKRCRTDVTNFAIFFNNSGAADRPSPTATANETGHRIAEDHDLPDECFWTRRPADGNDDDLDDQSSVQQVDKVCTTFNVDRSSLDRFLPMYNVAVNISTRMQYDRFTFILLFIPVDDDVRRLRLFAIRTFLDHEAELVRDLLAYVGQRLFSRLFRLDHRRAPFVGTLSAELSRAFARSFAPCSSDEHSGYGGGGGDRSRRLFLPSVFSYVVSVDSFLDQLCCSESPAPQPPVFSLLKASRDKLLALSRRVYNDPASVDEEVAVLKALSERLQSRKRKRVACSTRYDPFKRAKVRDDIEDASASTATATKRAIVEHINDEPEYWTERLQPATDGDRSISSFQSSPDFCSFAKFADQVNDRSAFANLDELCCSHDGALLSLPNAHLAFFQRYDTSSSSSSSSLSLSGDDHDDDARLVEMVGEAFHAIDPLLFDRQRLARDVVHLDTMTSCFLAGVQVEYFAARNKLNDVHRQVYLRHMELTRPRSFDYAAELNFTRNFTTYFDFYEMLDAPVETLLDNVPHIDASRILVPLEWLPNKMVRQALCTWSGHHLDFDIVPSLTDKRSFLDTDYDYDNDRDRAAFSPTYDFKRFVVCNYTRSRNYRRWSRYIRRVQRQASLIFDIDPSPSMRLRSSASSALSSSSSSMSSSSSSSSSSLSPRKQLTIREVLFGRETDNFASASGDDGFLGQLNQQSCTNSFLADVTSVLDSLMTKSGCKGGRSSDRFSLVADRNKCANWIFSLRGRFYGVKDSFPSARSLGRRPPVYDLNNSELYERSLIRLVVVKKMPQNSGSCVIWSPSSLSPQSTRTRDEATAVESLADRNNKIISSLPLSVDVLGRALSPGRPVEHDVAENNVVSPCSPYAAIASAVQRQQQQRNVEADNAVVIAADQSTELIDADAPEPTVVDFLRRFVDEHMSTDASAPYFSSSPSSSSSSSSTYLSSLNSTGFHHLRSKFAACLEQILFLDVLLRRSEPRFAVLVNGNPGTGKSTVMKYINRLVSRDSFTLLPTNVLREQVSSSLVESYEPLAGCPSISLVRRPVLEGPDEQGETTADSASTASTVSDSGKRFVDGQPVVLTVSSFIKRALRYNLGPDVYSKIIQRYLDQQLERLRLTLRPLSMTRDLFPLEKPVAAVLYPPIMQVDEYNLCNYSEHFVVDRACQQMCVSRIYYGDFAQSSPIRGVNDNAELIALFAPLTVQFLDNKRLLNLNDRNSDRVALTSSLAATPTTADNTPCVDLRTLLNDPIWNWKANNCDDGTNDYVRRLIARLVVRPIFEAHIARDRLLSSEVQIDVAELDRWYDSVAKLNDWFDQKPCRRYMADANSLDELVRHHYPTFQLPCFISRRNLDSDRINYWLSRAVEDYVADRCARQRTSGSNSDSSSSSRSFDKCFCLSVRRSAIASGEALKMSAHEIVHRSSADLDVAVFDNQPPVTSIDDDKDDDNDNGLDVWPKSQPQFRRARNEFTLLIDDDPWCADLSLIIGAVYRYIGPATKFMCSDSLLRLVAFLPEYQVDLEAVGDEPLGRSSSSASAATTHRPKKHERSGYRCNDQDCSLDCVRSVAALKRKLRTLEKLSPGVSPALPMTLGCGLPFVAHSDTVRNGRYLPAYPRLLMQRLRTRDDVAPASAPMSLAKTMTVDGEDNGNDDGNRDKTAAAAAAASSFVVLSRSKFTLNRCNSKWTTNIYTNQPKREGICLFGYPLVLNCGVSSWRVQGETIPTSRVFVDLKYMNKQQALVSLSRVRRSDQISRVLNVNLYAR